MKLWRCQGYYPDGSPAPIGFLYYSLKEEETCEFKEDITSIENIDLHWLLTGKDYKVAREVIKSLVATAGYVNLTSEEKLLAAKWFAVNMALPFVDGTISYNNEEADRDFVNLSNNWDRESKKARSRRFSKAKAVLLGRLGKVNGFTIISDLKNDNTIFDYVEYGRDGIETGSIEGLWDYIQATAGTTWEETGLATKGWDPIDGTTLQNVIDTIMDILKNGNYDNY